MGSDGRGLGMVALVTVTLLMIVGAFSAYAQEARPDSGNSSGATQDSGNVQNSPAGGGRVVGGGDGTTQTQDTSQGPRSQTRPGTAPQTGRQDAVAGKFPYSLPGMLGNDRVGSELRTQNPANKKYKTPCGSPECLAQLRTVKKMPISRPNLPTGGSATFAGSKFMGTTRNSRR
jgi:hypothetical protein